MTFEVPHKPGYRLKMRMGIHSGSVVAGVVGTKIPHYSVFGETVETAGLMESTGESMKIQVNKKVTFKLHFQICILIDFHGDQRIVEGSWRFQHHQKGHNSS